jgi:hypothetical protein
MGLNRMMMTLKKGNVADGSKFWPAGKDGEIGFFTVPPGIKRIKVFAEVYYAEGDPDIYFYASITCVSNSTNKVWGEGGSATNDEAENVGHENINSIVGVTPNKTYVLNFDCAKTSGVTFSWGQAINDMPPTVEDY